MRFRGLFSMPETFRLILRLKGITETAALQLLRVLSSRPRDAGKLRMEAGREVGCCNLGCIPGY